ncbi:ubiquitin 3 binding protein But2 [Clohesyomyces aquaticus]|uniref:Ubiquitin 3 binding protein But2 n=1 Tax=Clohesyomyces aquaticus TaxID=1231657 RepID=A0A1Y2A719_9PLEO|nr:ubiquitin 3 binding protein But2 [Clohesyomyces aquaticus]
MRSIILIPALFALQPLGALIDIQFPHAIVPLIQAHPDYPHGTQFTAQVGITGGDHQIYTEVNFDIPPNNAKTCRLNFHLVTPNKDPQQATLTGNPPYVIEVAALDPVMNTNTDTWNNRPAVKGGKVATIEIQMDGSAVVTGGYVPCASGTWTQFLIYPGSTRTLGLTWFEMSNPLNGITYELYND